MNHSETVILVHGLAGTRLDMWPIARRLRRHGYAVKYFNYWSLGNDIPSLAKRFGEIVALTNQEAADQTATNQQVSADSERHGKRFHLVTFSMGCIIARALLAEEQFDHLGRVVMLAPPHRGSHAARFLAPFCGWLAPSVPQLSDAEDSYVNRLPNSLHEKRIEFGLVRAKKDRVIKPANIFLDGYRDFAVVNGHHGILPWYNHTQELVLSFLAQGEFEDSERAGRPESGNSIAQRV